MASPDVAGRLGQFWIFEGLSPDELAHVAGFVHEKAFSAGHVLFRQGDPPDHFYLVDSGTVQEVGKDPAGKAILQRTAEAGSFVGCRSLMAGIAQEATATVTRDARLLVIRGDAFHTLLEMFPVLPGRLQRTSVVNRLLAIPLFGCFSEAQLLHVADLVHQVEYPAGQVVFSQGEQPDAFYVIDTGQIMEEAGGTAPGRQTWPKYLSAGNYFGRYSLLNNTPRRATATAVSDVSLFRLGVDAFHRLRQLCPEFDQALRRPDILRYLRDTPLFAGLRDDELKHLAGYVGLAHFRPGDAIYRQGETDPTLYILYQGEAIVRARDERGMERPRKYLKDGNAVGESSLFLEEPRDVSIVSMTETDWFYLTRQDLEQFLAQRANVRGRLVVSEEVRARQKLKQFDWMETDEKVVLERRRHWVALVRRLAPPVLLSLILLTLLLFPADGWKSILNAIDLVVLVVAALWMAWRAIDWYNDYFVVTTKRVAHREKTLWVRERRYEAPLTKVQNVNTDRGFWGNWLGFGQLAIDTAVASGVVRVTFDYLADPDQVQALILAQMSRVQAGERLEARRAIQDRLETTLGTSIRPLVPRPAVPSAAVAPQKRPTRALWKQVINATLGRVFWIEDRTDDQVTWRKHWIRLVARVWKPSLIALVAVAGFALLIQDRLAGFVGSLLFLLPCAVWWWWSWEDWRNDLYIVTNDRIIDTWRLPLGFRSRRTETTFDKIQNISYDIPDPIATALNYGTVFIYTAGVEGRLDFEFVRDPRAVQAEIFRRLATYESAQRRQQREQHWDDMSTWFSVFQERRPG